MEAETTNRYKNYNKCPNYENALNFLMFGCSNSK